MSFPIQPAVNDARRKRNALAGSVRAALLRLETNKLTASPNPQARFEVQALEKALAALLDQPPESLPSREMQALERELELLK
jgi:hypothetical protein